MPEMILGYEALQLPCQLHRSHRPDPLYVEQHHVVPRAWQQFWQPAVAPFPGTYAGQKLWDDRTVNICRTGHGNVHYWIVRLTRNWVPGDMGATIAGAKHSAPERPGPADFATALQALERYMHVGGSINDLVAASEWGQI